MREFYDAGCMLIRAYKDNEVTLPSDDDFVEEVTYPESQMVGVFKKSAYQKRLQRDSAEGLPSSEGGEQTYHFASEPPADDTNTDITYSNSPTEPTYHFDTETLTPSADSVNVELASDDIIACEGELTRISTREIVGVCKHEDNLRRAYNTQYDKVLSSVNSKNLLYVVETLDGATVPYNVMRNNVADFEGWVKGSSNFTFGAHFLEPHADGSWHNNHLLYFRDGIPDGIDEEIIEWWAQRNGKKCDEQVEVVFVEDDEHLLNILRYLKPTRGEKRERIKFYPLGKQPFGVFGEIQKPTRSLVKYGEIKEELGKEFTEHRRRLEKVDPATEEIIAFVSSYIFKAKLPEKVVEKTYHFADVDPDTYIEPEPPPIIRYTPAWCSYRTCWECDKKDNCEDYLVMCEI